MRRARRGTLLVAGTALALLAVEARGVELGPLDTCSRADSHATQAHDGPAAWDDAAAAALAVEATRVLPALGAEGPPATVDDDARRDSELGASSHDVVPPVAAAAGPRRPDGWRPPRTATLQGLLDAATGPDLRSDVAGATLAFHDSSAPRERARDLRRLRELKVLRLLDTSSVMVWLGLDRKGRPGLHFRQRNLDEQLPAAEPALLAGPPPLRSVPLTSF